MFSEYNENEKFDEGGENLSKEVVLKIKEVEAEAEKIRSDAVNEAKRRVQQAELEGKKLLEKANADSDKLNAQRLALTRQKSDELVNGVKNRAAEDAERMRDAAEFNMREAIRFIISGVKQQCQ